MSDHLFRAIIEDADLRALAVVSTETCRDACSRHLCAPTAAMVTSEALTSALLLARLQKEPHRVTLHIECDGPIGGIVADADDDGGVRGFPRMPAVHFPGPDAPLTEPAFGGRANVHVLQELQPGEWYKGTVEMPGRSVSRGIEAYLASSQQTESVVDVQCVLGADGLPSLVVGVLFQRLPAGSRAAIEAIRVRLAEGWLADYVHGAAASDEPVTGARILDGILGGPEAKGGDNIQLLERATVSFRCRCDRHRVVNALITLGDADLAEMIREGDTASVTCDFCRDTYEVSTDELEEIRSLAAGDD